MASTRKDYFGYDEWGFVESPPLTWDLMLEMWKWGSVFYGGWVFCYVIVMDIIFFKQVGSGEWRNSQHD